MNKKKRVNMNMRIAEEDRNTIHEAAQVLDVSTSSFVISNALKEARKIIKGK